MRGMRESRADKQISGNLKSCTVAQKARHKHKNQTQTSGYVCVSWPTVVLHVGILASMGWLWLVQLAFIHGLLYFVVEMTSLGERKHSLQRIHVYV